MIESALPSALRNGSASLFKRIVNLSLKKWREEAELSQKQAAARINRTAQHISNMETGRLPSQSDMEILLSLYGKEDRVPFMVELLSAARKDANWWKALSGAVPDWFDLFLALESGATELSSFDAMVVPGLLQTAAYARAVMRGNPDLTDEQVEQGVDLRTGRQEMLDRIDAPHVWTIMDESVLHRLRGDRQTMLGQYKHLLAASERPRVDIQILPLSAGATSAQQGGTFKVMAFPPEMLTDAGLVYIEVLTGGRYIEKPLEIAEYQREISRLRTLAADPKESRGIIRKAMKEVT